MINKAEIGDYLYYIIFVIVIIVSIFEKISKSKRQQNVPAPTAPRHYDDFEDVEKPTVSKPQSTIEEVLRRMMQIPETVEHVEELAGYQDEAQSLEYIPVTSSFDYQPLVSTIVNQQDTDFSSSESEEEKEITGYQEYIFDVRQAVISSELLNRKY